MFFILNNLKINSIKKKAGDFYKNYPKTNFDIEEFERINISIDKVESHIDIDVLSRLATVNEALKYAKNCINE